MGEAAFTYTNRLKDEKSPYLRQHAHNPVDWYPWSQEALEKARSEGKPMLVSIGYSTCHWCHVMERESYEDPGTARIMNDRFVNIKVDREERPDIDSLYMKAVQALTGHTGWPLNVFTTPEGVPFFGGTYFPPDARHGLPSFKEVLLTVSDAYERNKDRLGALSQEIEKALTAGPKGHAPGAWMSEAAYETAKRYFDPVDGGFGGTMKFPNAMFLKFLLKYYRRTSNGEAIFIVKKTLSAMASGGLRDHIGGGFHRYCVDPAWEVPHFEKMLYDNALLLGLYASAFATAGYGLYREAAVDTAEYMLREMRSPEGGFYSAQDADSEGEEGKFYLWTLEDIEDALGHGAGRFAGYFSMTREGNYEGKNTLRISLEDASDKGTVDEEIRSMKEALFRERARRVPPDTDRKIITAWNGLAIDAFASASKALGRADFMDVADRCADFFLNKVRGPGGRLLRYYLDGASAVKAGLEDYALLGSALTTLHEATGSVRRLDEALEIAEEMIRLFRDEGTGLFYDTGADQERLFLRERDLSDSDIPSGNSAAAGLLLRLSKATGDEKFRDLAMGILTAPEGITYEPLSYGNFLSVVEDLIYTPKGN